MVVNYRHLIKLELLRGSHEKIVIKEAEMERTRRPKRKTANSVSIKHCSAQEDAAHNFLISLKFVEISIISSCIVAFFLGCVMRLRLSCVDKSVFWRVPKTSNAFADVCPDTTKHNIIWNTSSVYSPRTELSMLPSPTLLLGKEAPVSIYTNKIFESVSVAAATSSTVHLDRTPPMESVDSELRLSGANVSRTDFVKNEIHLPAGQHLLVDIKNVDSNFLNSEVQLAHAMVELINESKLTLLSYHCHSLVPTGVSCAGVLLESHITFHTWPFNGVILLDLFTCGSSPLVPVLPSIEHLFAIPQRGLSAPNPTMMWSHKLRGFRDGFDPGYERRRSPLEHDLGMDTLACHSFDFKRPVVSKETEYQHIDVIGLIDPKVRKIFSHEKSISDDGSYEALHPEFYRIDRKLYLDGQLQSTLLGETAYHEALVHPAMLSHPNPKRVAIIGGGEGATLREVLKHTTVEEAVMLEIDDEEIEILRDVLPEWSDCSDMHDGFESCFDDERANIYTVDASQWFIERFGTVNRMNANQTSSMNEFDESPFDVIIMDALDLDDEVDFAVALYHNTIFFQSLKNGLTEDGILVIQIGRSPYADDPADENGAFKARADMIQTLKYLGFESMHVYEEGHSDFGSPWGYLVAFKDYETRSNWYRNEAEISIEIKKRIRKTKSGRPTLTYFDAATMIGYQVPPKSFEINYCRQSNNQVECNDIFLICEDVINYTPREVFEVRNSSVGEHAGRGLFAKHDISENSCVATGTSTTSFQVLPSTWSTIQTTHQELIDRNVSNPMDRSGLGAMITFISGYGYSLSLLGKAHMAVDSDIMLFMNHGCQGTYNFGDEYSPTNEQSADLTRIAQEYETEVEVYSPVVERRIRSHSSGPEHVLRDIKAGEEILANYLAFVARVEEWEEGVLDLRGQCAGETVGEITDYESENEYP